MRPRPSIPRVVAWVCAGSFRLRNIMIRLDFASRGGRAWRAGVAEGLLTGILASLGCLVAAALGIAIAVFTVHEPNLIPGRQVDRLVIEIEAFAVVPIAVLITLVRRWLRLPPSPISGAIVGLIAALVIVPPMVSLEALPHYFAFIREFAGPKGPFPPDVVEYRGVGPGWLAPGIYFTLFAVAGLLVGIVGRSLESALARPRGAIKSTTLYSVIAGIGVIGVGALVFVYLGPLILGSE